MASKIAWWFGIIFVVIGVLGFINNPIVGDGALFHTDLMHNLVHIISGLIFIWASKKGSSAGVLKLFGVVYLAVAIIGLMGSGDSVLGLIAVNGSDNWLHLVLALIFLWAGFGGRKSGSNMGMGQQM